jgi:predicted nucleic acid-binding Zn ribbon protein
MFKYNVTEAAVTKTEVPASKKKKKTAGRTVKLKSSKWYQNAARSIGITKESLVESRDGVFN